MSYNFLDKKYLSIAVHEAESYMRPFFEPVAEQERLARGLPGRVPKGKPRVTDNTLASIIKEGSKRVIQQLPTGKVTVKNFPEIEAEINAVLTDDILVHANSGGTPFSKSKKGVKSAFTNGAAHAYCFYNRRGDWFGADFRIPYVKDVYYEKGKTSEFDCNTMFLVGWYTVSDLKAIQYWQQKFTKEGKEKGNEYKGDWDLKVLEELIQGGQDAKDDENKSEEEKKRTSEDNGYIKLVHCFQVGKGAEFYAYSPKLDKIAKTCVNKDPRGIIPIHTLLHDEDGANPLGESLIALSAGKQNLLDFDMQMYQYNRGLLLSPPIQKWGNVPTKSIRLVPDAVIDMGQASAGAKLEALKIDNSAINQFPTNYSLIKSQILNESGMMDSSVSSEAGNPGFSKTDAGVDMMAARLSISDNSMRKNYEQWFGRVCETLLNIHFADSHGTKELDLQSETVKRMKLAKGSSIEVNYDADYGPIAFTVDASTSAAEDSSKKNERLVGLLEITSQYGGLPPHKQMEVINQIIKNSGVDDPENLMYSDDEIQQAQQQQDLAQQQAAAEAEAAAQMAAQPQGDPALMQEAPDMAAMGEIPAEIPAETGVATQLEPENAVSQNITDDELQVIEALKSRGLPDENIATALVMLRNDYSDEEIAQVLGGNA